MNEKERTIFCMNFQKLPSDHLLKLCYRSSITIDNETSNELVHEEHSAIVFEFRKKKRFLSHLLTYQILDTITVPPENGIQSWCNEGNVFLHYNGKFHISYGVEDWGGILVLNWKNLVQKLDGRNHRSHYYKDFELVYEYINARVLRIIENFIEDLSIERNHI